MNSRDSPENKKEQLIELKSESPSEEAEKMLRFLKTEVRGQNRALEYIADAWEIYRAGLRNPKKPILNTLLLGPSGSGKTLLARKVAHKLFNDENGLTKINCEIFEQGHEVSWLTGSPPGYIGFTNNPLELEFSQFNIDKYDFRHKLMTGQLQSRVWDNPEVRKALSEKAALQKRLGELEKNKAGTPETRKKAIDKIRLQLAGIEDYLEDKAAYSQASLEKFKDLDDDQILGLYQFHRKNNVFQSVILFDEVEKADRKFHNILLGLLDEGELSVGGEKTFFRNSFVFLTSNIGSDELSSLLRASFIGFTAGQHQTESPEKLKNIDDQIYFLANEAAKRFFPPEFLNRMDKIIIFRPLSRETMMEIFDLEVRKFRQHLWKVGMPLMIEFTKEAKERIVDEAIRYPETGARMIEKRLDRDIIVGLSRLYNRGEIQPGCLIVISFVDGEFRFQKDISQKLVFPKDPP